MAMLKIVGREGPGECLALKKQETTIGRAPTCGIVVSAPLVSRNHARILREPDGFYLEDLNSSNGTYLNGVLLEKRHKLAEGDLFSVHDMQFQFWELSLDPAERSIAVLAETQLAPLREIDVFDPATVVGFLDPRQQEYGRFDVKPAAKLRAILEMTRSVGTSLVLEDVLPNVLDGLFKIFPEADRGYILLRDGDGDDVFPYATKYRNEHDDEGETIPPMSRTIARRVMQDRKAILSSDATTDDRFKHIASVHELSIRSMMAAPLLGLHGAPVGVIHLDRQDPISAFGVDDLEVLVSAASLAGHAVAYTQIHQERLNERQQADERFRRLLEAAPDAVVVIDETGRIALVNAETERLFGYPRDEILGQEVERLIPQQRRAQPQSGRVRGFSDTQLQPTKPGMELFGRRKNGGEFPVEISLSPLETDEGTQVFIAIRDMTAIKRAQEKALQAQRLAAIGEMMAGLAHESRNALQRSQSCLEMLELQVDDRPKAIELIGRLQEAQDHLHRLYEDVRQYAAPVRPNRQVCDLNEVLQTAWDHLESIRGDRDAHLHIEATSMELISDVDAFQLEQVFRNILENSLAAGLDPVEITAKWGHTELNGRAAVGVSLRDNGPGLTDEQRQRMFEPFFTTKTHGTGLGLAIAKRIVDVNGGRLQVGKDPPPGAELIVILPRSGT